MRAVVQRIHEAVCKVNGKITGQCEYGLCIMLGVNENDNEVEARVLADKIAKLRIFKDEEGKLKYSVQDVKGSAIVISNFTLCADCRHGNRPEFVSAMKSDQAEYLYGYFVSLLREKIGCVATGSFGQHMHIDLDLNGPVTIVIDSEELYSKERVVQ